MTHSLTRGRRFAVVSVALALAGVLFRSQLAQALVVRGDDLAYRGQRAAALVRYARANALDPNLGVAVDRYVFLSMQRHDMASLRAGIAAATAYLRHRPSDASILADRGLCHLLERRYALARLDFETAARLSPDPRADFIAGWAARRTADLPAARAWWRKALKLDPAFEPAAAALKKYHS